MEGGGEGGDPSPVGGRPHDGAGGDEAAEALLVGERVARPDAAPAQTREGGNHYLSGRVGSSHKEKK